jgi:hypothetical protein
MIHYLGRKSCSRTRKVYEPTTICIRADVFSIDDQDPSKKYVTPLITTERRICFREVRVVPKSASADGTTLIPVEGTGEKQEGQVTETVPPTMSDVHGLERITGVSGPTRRRPRASKGKTPRTKKPKPSDNKDSPLAQELENEGTSMRPTEAMEVDG